MKTDNRQSKLVKNILSSYFSEIGRKGGKTSSSDREHMSEIAKKGWAQRKENTELYEFLNSREPVMISQPIGFDCPIYAEKNTDTFM